LGKEECTNRRLALSIKHASVALSYSS